MHVGQENLAVLITTAKSIDVIATSISVMVFLNVQTVLMSVAVVSWTKIQYFELFYVELVKKKKLLLEKKYVHTQSERTYFFLICLAQKYSRYQDRV